MALQTNYNPEFPKRIQIQYNIIIEEYLKLVKYFMDNQLLGANGLNEIIKIYK